MARSRVSSLRRTGGSNRRIPEWFAGPGTNDAIQTVTGAGTILWALGQEATTVLTTVRIRGEISLWLPLVTTVGDGFSAYYLGIGIASFDAFSAGIASLPTPQGDRDWGGWLWFHAGAAIVGNETTELFRGPMSAVRIQIDTKAMRKMSANEIIFGAISLVNEVGAAELDFVASTRMLTLHA